VIELFHFQHAAVAQIADRFAVYWSDRPWHGSKKKGGYVPFYQALASITASGKTVIMAQTVSEIAPLLPVKPVVIWLSKGKIVVDQTYANLQDGGKYRHLLADFHIRFLSEFSSDECEDSEASLLYVATVGTFNQKDKDKSDLRVFRSDVDYADKTTWAAIQHRTSGGVRRPLVIVYDEAHNLTDQQTNLLMELEPDALLVASATPSLPNAIHKIVSDLRSDLGWGDEMLTTYVDSKEVVDSGLVKSRVDLVGYQADPDETINDLLDDLRRAEEGARTLALPITPKAIYVCRTNIVEDNALQSDDPKRPFEQREAPPIRIWRYLVDDRGVDPASIATYTSALKFDKAYPAPGEFVHFKGGDSDYARFVAGSYKHVIFNLGLQEGWDDAECYFAYIDKSMGSAVQVEQVIGRVLRQPYAKHYTGDILNTAHFYVRVDKQGVFADIVGQVQKKLAKELPQIEIRAYDPTKKERPIAQPPRKLREVPAVYLDPQDAKGPIDAVLQSLVDFRRDTSDNVRGKGVKSLVQYEVGTDQAPRFEWVERDASNTVSARWIFATTVRRQFYRALEVTASDHPKLDARVQLGSPASAIIRGAADEVVERYLQHVRLRQRHHNPYIVGDAMVTASKATKFSHALHDSYSGLNQDESPFAEELDRLKLDWCRNPSQSGYGIPLLTRGGSKTFYPDFLVWKGNAIFALDPTGEHILQEKLGRKLLDITPHAKSKTKLWIRLVSRGEWNDHPQKVSSEGFTVWRLGPGHTLVPTAVGSVADAVKTSLRPG